MRNPAMEAPGLEMILLLKLAFGLFKVSLLSFSRYPFYLFSRYPFYHFPVSCLSFPRYPFYPFPGTFFYHVSDTGAGNDRVYKEKY